MNEKSICENCGKSIYFTPPHFEYGMTFGYVPGEWHHQDTFTECYIFLRPSFLLSKEERDKLALRASPEEEKIIL